MISQQGLGFGVEDRFEVSVSDVGFIQVGQDGVWEFSPSFGQRVDALMFCFVLKLPYKLCALTWDRG